MLRSYFYIALRNIKKDKVFSLLNVTGLAVGIACFLTLYLFVQDELSYDRFEHPQSNGQIYRVFVRTSINGIADSNSKTAGMLGPVLKEDFPEVLSYARIGYYGPRAFLVGDKIFRKGNIYAVDSTFFDVFTLSFIEGDPKTALTRPNSLVLTETSSHLIFGDESPVGKTLHSDDGKDFLVTALIKDFPRNSHFRCDYLESLSTYEVNQGWLDLWYSTYIILKNGTDPAMFEKKMAKIVDQYVGPEAESMLGVPIQRFLEEGNEYGFHLQPFSSIYLHSQRDYGIDPNTEWGNVITSDIAYTYIFSAVAAFILLIAVINFMNLTTAKSESRAKEVGIKKTFGSGRFHLIAQFIGEAVILSVSALILSLGLLAVILPLFNNLVERDLKFVIINEFYTVPLLIVFILVVGILAGSYPAFYLSAFPPSKIFRSNQSSEGRKSMLRSILVVVQFAISISLLIGTIIINDQLAYMRDKNLGFRKDLLFSVNNASLLRDHMEAFKQELLKNPEIKSLTSASLMFGPGVPGSGYLYNKKTGTDPILCQFLDVDYDFIETFRIPLQSGRFFSREFPADKDAVVINEAAVQAFQTDEPLNNTLTSINVQDKGHTYEIIGVVKDFNYESLHTKVRPLVLHLGAPRQPATILTARLSGSNMTKTIDYIEKTWKKFTAENEIMYSRFVDETLARLYRTEEKTSTVSAIFSTVAIFIACLGLFGLAAFVTEQRTKEIGIRKVLGASIPEIVTILSKEFAIWVLLANFLAWPVTYFIMKNWLQNFAFRINMNWYVFVLSGLAALLIALFTVGLHVIKAARANPVESLKYE